MDKIFIRNLAARGIIGVYEWERNEPQDFLVNIDIFTDLLKSGASDAIKDTVSYETIVHQVLEICEHSHRQTVEALAQDIAKICLENKSVQKVRVRVEKFALSEFAEGVGVEIIRDQGDF